MSIPSAGGAAAFSRAAVAVCCGARCCATLLDPPCPEGLALPVWWSRPGIALEPAWSSRGVPAPRRSPRDPHAIPHRHPPAACRSLRSSCRQKRPCLPQKVNRSEFVRYTILQQPRNGERGQEWSRMRANAFRRGRKRAQPGRVFPCHCFSRTNNVYPARQHPQRTCTESLPPLTVSFPCTLGVSPTRVRAREGVRVCPAWRLCGRIPRKPGLRPDRMPLQHPLAS